jgi:nicotinamidase-related amidase
VNDYTRPDFGAAALITIDTQCDTLDGQPLEIPGTSAVLPQIKRLLDTFRRAGKPIVHIVRIYQRDGANVDLCRRAVVENGHSMLLEDSPGCQLAPELLPQAGIRLDTKSLLGGGVQQIAPQEAIIYKSRWGAYYRTPLESHLRSLSISTLVFSGCNFPNCPRTSIYEASERDFRIVLVTDAISGLYERGTAEMRNIGVQLSTCDEILAVIAARS